MTAVPGLALDDGVFVGLTAAPGSTPGSGDDVISDGFVGIGVSVDMGVDAGTAVAPLLAGMDATGVAVTAARVVETGVSGCSDVSGRKASRSPISTFRTVTPFWIGCIPKYAGLAGSNENT